MKIGQLIEYNMRNIFREKSCKKYGEETIPRANSRAYLWIHSLNFYATYFYCMSSLELFSILKLRCRPLAFTSYKAFLKKTKRVLELVPWFIFWIIFEEKYLYRYVLLPDQLSLSDCFYFVRYWVTCVLQLFVDQVVTSKILKLTLSS